MAEKIKKTLNPQQELFCQYFASDREFFGNGVQSYIEAYGIDVTRKGAYNVAKANAHRLLTNAYITKRIDELFEASGLNDTFVDKQIEKLIVQDADFSAKLSAIREYNALRNRITKNIKATVELPAPILGGATVKNPADDINEK
jgi:hypothetical protein